MGDMSLIPVGGNMGGEAGAAGLGGAVGGLIGSWFGGNGGAWGGRGGATVVSGGDNSAAISLAGSAANMLTTALVSDIQSIQNDLSNLGLNVVQGQGATNLAIAQSASQLGLATMQGQAMNLNAITQQNSQNLLTNVQGFNGVNTAIQQTSCATLNAIGAADRASLERNYQAQLAAERCCCETNLNIERQANQTRDLMRQQFADAQAVLICDMKSQIQQRDMLLSQAAQTAQLRCEINQVNQLVNFKIPTPPTPPTGCC